MSKKKYTFLISKYGGEVAMGIISPEQYEYWYERNDEELKDYVMGWQTDQYEKEHNVPLKARMHNWFEYEDIHHSNGAEIADSQQLFIEEYDSNDILLKKWDPINLDAETRDKMGIKLSDFESFDSNHKSLENKNYFWGRAVNEGSWYTNKISRTSKSIDIFLNAIILLVLKCNKFPAFTVSVLSTSKAVATCSNCFLAGKGLVFVHIF